MKLVGLTSAIDEDYRVHLQISVAVRWFLIGAWLVQTNYRPDFDDPTYLPNTLLTIAVAILNGYVHWRITKRRPVTWPWALGLSTLDVTAISLGMILSGGFDNNLFILYYPALAAFAIVFTSTSLSIVGVSAVALAYMNISLLVGDGVSFVDKEEKMLFMRLVTMFAVVGAVNLISRQQRAREIERTLQRERIRVSDEIHDGAAQSGYAISLGLDTCSSLAEQEFPEFADRIRRLGKEVRHLLWELRFPINLGPVFEGRALSRVLEDHVANFAALTSIPTSFTGTGTEGDLPADKKQKIFYVAHNVVTNAYRHAQASQVDILLACDGDNIELTIKDDGLGFDIDQAESGSGRGLTNVRRAAEELGGTLAIRSAKGSGTEVQLIA